MAYDVDEWAATFVPSTNGTIVSPQPLGGGGIHFHEGAIDARGADTPQRLKRLSCADLAGDADIMAATLRAGDDRSSRINPGSRR